MGRIETLLSYNENADQRPYKFVIHAEGGPWLAIYELEYGPDDWDDEIIFERNKKYKGVFRKYADGVTEFPKDGRDHLKDIYESNGVTAEATLYVYKLNKLTFVFEEQFIGKIEFSTYKIDELFVSVQIMDNSFSERMKNRENVEVNVLSEETIDGGNVPAFAADNENFTFPSINITSQANWVRAAIASNTYGSGVPLDTLHFLMPITFSEIPEAQSVVYPIPPYDNQYFINNAADDYTCFMTIKLKQKLYNLTGGNASIYSITLKLLGADGGDIVIDSNTTYVASSVTLNVDVTKTFSISAGAQLELVSVLYRNPSYCGGCIRYVETWDMDIKIEYQLSTLGQHFVTGLPIYEAFLRTIQKITNQEDPFKSEFFGRTDSEIRTYASDGQLGHITKGALMRRLDETVDVNFSVTLEDMFKSMNAVFNLGLGIEIDSGEYIVRIEEEAYFFDDEIIIDISDRISEAEIKKEVLPERHFAQIKTGYEKTEKEVKNAIFEYNSKQTYASRIDSLAPRNNTLDLISKFRADTNGIIVSREHYTDSNSEDVKGDDDVFIVDTVRDPLGASEFRARTDEDFILIEGTIDSDQYYNYDLTPKRNLLRHGGEIRAGLERVLNTPLTFQAADKIITLTTQRTAADPVVEASDEIVNDLGAPRWWAEAYEIDTPFYKADIDAIEANPRGLIKLSATKYGWILKVKTKKENKATLRLLRCNLNHVTPV